MGLGWLTPSQFWASYPDELHWLMEAKRPRNTYGKLTEVEVEECYEEIIQEEAMKEWQTLASQSASKDLET